MKVEKLPAEVRSKLQSGMVVTDAVQCVLELVHNSLDAEATGIAVRVDLKTHMIRVIDNGRGIDIDDLELVGERYMTSKYHSFVEMETSVLMYGFRGQALSSLLDVSRSLTIETKVTNEGPTYVKVFKNNKAEPITMIKSGRNGTGTTITIEDFMYSMPVRRKRICEVFDMEEIKNQLQHLALIHYNVCFTLRNENKGLILLQTPQASNALESISNIFGKTVAKSLKPVQYQEQKYEVTGFISLKPQTQSNIQLIYINKKIISKGVIHKFINSIIKEYSVKKNLFGDSPAGQILKQLKASHNVFIIKMQCPHSYYELFTNLRKVTVEFRNWKEALKSIHRAIKKTFNDALNLDSSSSQHCDKRNKAEDEKEEKGAFGTSLLVNAVRGAPAKRAFKKQSGTIKKRLKVTNNIETVALLLNKTPNNEELITSLSTSFYQNECTNDTFESPLPKKSLKAIKRKEGTQSEKLPFNQSFMDFYEWLKTRFDTDVNAYNLYSDFLKYKNRRVGSPEVSQFQSPILKVKQKKNRIQGLKKKNMEEKQKPLGNALSLLDEEIATVTQKQLKIFPKHLRLKKAVQFTSEMNVVPENLNLNIQSESFYLERRSSQVFRKPESFAIFSRHKRQVECSHTLTSLPSSEVQFTNIIKFRNMSESFFHQTSDVHETEYHGTERTLSTSNTWVSHYQNLPRDAELCEKKSSTKNFQCLSGANETHRKSVDFENFEGSFIEFSKSRQNAVFQNVEIQVNMSFNPPQKVNAMVQTFQQIPESPGLENSYVFNVSQEECGIINTEKVDFNLQTEQQTSGVTDITNQEVPNPDFWNTSAHMQFEAQNLKLCVTNENEMILNISSDNIKKISTSNEFICGHKSQSSTKVESTSKETQTLAAIWTGSLIEMGFLPKSNEASATKENMQLSEPTTISKTIPIEEIECNHAQLMAAEFCMTERHDFVPKGLSPKFFESETPKVFSLSPGEKCKIKSTIDNAQNEFLATIKWQNEITGDCLKPTIPDGIIYEIRRKAGENVANYENPVLSATLSYCAVKVHNLLHSFVFTKELLLGIEVLGQLDKKFIVTKMNISTPKKMELISLFDQHAVDERIKLEEIINENVSPDGKFSSSRPKSPIECTLTESDVRIISNFKEKFLKYGLEAEPINENTVSVNEIPTFLLKKHKDDLKNKKESLSDAVRALMLNIIKEVAETRGAISGIPKIMHNAFCLEACHKAIKFNKPLSIENMDEMISKLEKCKLPFQCAHGRPSLIPIIDLEDFRPMMEETDAVNLEKLKKFDYKREDSETIELKK